MKKRNIYFILLNILFTFIEYILLFLLFNKALSIKLIISLLIIIILLVINILLSKVLTKNIFKDVVIDDEKKINNYHNKLIPFINNINNKLKINIKIEYVDLDIRPNPAWCVDDTIYINIAYSSPNNELLGMCAHEVGHLYSGLTKHIYLYYLRATSIIALMINLLIKLICLIVDKNKVLKIIGTIFFIPLYLLYIIINFFNHLIIYPFLREDENIANEIAIKLGYGNELLYYYKQIKYNEDIYSIKLQRLTDFEHPHVDKMINLMIKQLNDENVSNGYIIYNNKLMLCDNKETVINIPNSVLTIDYHAFLFKENVEEIYSETLEKIESFKNLKHLKKLYTPNLNSFPTNLLVICKNLKDIKIENVDENYLLGLSYLNINNKETAQLIFEQNNNHKPSLKELLKLYKDEELIISTHQKLAELNDINSIKYLIEYYEKYEQYDIALIYIDKIAKLLPSFANYKKGVYYYFGYYVDQNLELAKEYLSLSNEKAALELLQEISKGEEE